MGKLKKNHDEVINDFKTDPLDHVMTPIQAESIPSPTAHLERLLEEVYSTKNINVKTDLTERQILALLKLDAYGKKFKSPLALFVSKNFKELSVSKKRKGRQEFVQVSKAMQPNLEMDIPEPRSRLLGK